jgi:hypothetical protein
MPLLADDASNSLTGYSNTFEKIPVPHGSRMVGVLYLREHLCQGQCQYHWEIVDHSFTVTLFYDFVDLEKSGAQFRQKIFSSICAGS